MQIFIAATVATVFLAITTALCVAMVMVGIVLIGRVKFCLERCTISEVEMDHAAVEIPTK